MPRDLQLQRFQLLPAAERVCHDGHPGARVPAPGVQIRGPLPDYGPGGWVISRGSHEMWFIRLIGLVLLAIDQWLVSEWDLGFVLGVNQRAHPSVDQCL